MKLPKNYNSGLPDLNLVLVEGGEFMMGKDSQYDFEKPVHEVVISSFYMCKYQVTQRLWVAIMGYNPSKFKGDLRPVQQVSWNDAQNFVKKLNEETGEVFRLPTESEWEYSARGGKYSQGYKYAGSDNLRQVGWYKGNSKRQTQNVGQLIANELGLYDMSGNVWEWCEDIWHDSYQNKPVDASAWIDSDEDTSRVLRGGSYFNVEKYCISTHRSNIHSNNRINNTGFRLALSI